MAGEAEKQYIEEMKADAAGDPVALEALDWFLQHREPPLDQSVALKPYPPTKPSGWLRRLFRR